MQFDAIIKEAVILNPMDNMNPKTISSEIRLDPLTRRTARICPVRALSWTRPDFAKLTAGTEAVCPFCPGRVETMTPAFPADIVPEGRLTSGDMVLFPNLAPYDRLSTVLVLGARHFVPMNEMEPARLAQGFRLAMDFFRRVHALGHPESVYHLINWNYMPVSGSTIIHPHLQVFASSSAPNLLRQELSAAKDYAETNGANYWDDLVRAEEAAGDRFLGRIGRTSWLSAYAPMGVAGDVMAVVEGVRTTLELTDDDLADLALGLTKAMQYYDSLNIYNFNLGLFTGAEGDDSAGVHVVFSPRAFFNQALGTPDVPAPRFLYNETVCFRLPEETAQGLRTVFQG